MAANDFKGASPAALSAGRKRPNFSEADLYCAARMRLFNCDELYRWRVNPADFFLNQLLGVEGTGVPTEFSLGVVSHNFKRIIAVAVVLQAAAVGGEEAFWTEHSPLNGVNQFVEVYLFGRCPMLFQKECVEVSDRIEITELVFCNLPQP